MHPTAHFARMYFDPDVNYWKLELFDQTNKSLDHLSLPKGFEGPEGPAGKVEPMEYVNFALVEAGINPIGLGGWEKDEAGVYSAITVPIKK